MDYSDFEAAATTAGHILERDEDGRIDWWAHTSGGSYCNGPACTECGRSWCVHCERRRGLALGRCWAAKERTVPELHASVMGALDRAHAIADKYLTPPPPKVKR